MGISLELYKLYKGFIKMITWMQRHKKWLIITIWISTIAFIGAGFVGWGAYSYGDKASSVAKVGDVEITVGEFQKTYSNIYAQYAQMFQENFDQEKAKMFGIDKQTLQQLIQQALILNLAKEFDLSVSDEELTREITSLSYFQTNGKFDKKLYKELLLRNNLKVKEFEEGMRKELLIRKTLKLFPLKTSQNESRIIDTIFNIADKIKYKLISADSITVSIDEAELEKFWEQHKEEFKTQENFTIEFITQAPLTKIFDDATISSYYNDNKTHFRAKDGKILPLEKAKEQVIKELNAKETKKEALRKYIAFKKGEIQAKDTTTISKSDNKFSDKLLRKVAALSPTSPFLKPIEIDGTYVIVKLVKKTPSQTKTFKAAKAEIFPQFIAKKRKEQLLELAKKSIQTFNGTISDFVTIKDAQKLEKLDEKTANKFLAKLFQEQTKQGYIVIDNNQIVLYDILEQKLLTNTHNESEKMIAGTKQGIFNENLIKTLRKKYDIEIYYEGL